MQIHMLISHTTHSHAYTHRQYEYTDMHRKQLRTFLFPIRPAYRFPPAPKAAKRKQRNFIMRRQNKGKIVSEGDGGVRPPRERMSRTELN